MNVPESLPQIAAFVLMLVPGLTWAVVKTWLVGVRDPDYGAGTRILDALFISAVFLVLYSALALVVFVGRYSLEVARGVLDIAYKEWPSWALALAGFGLLVVVPGLTSYFANRRRVTYAILKEGPDGQPLTKLKKRAINRPNSIPTAWDKAAYESVTYRWVRVRVADKLYFGGYFGPGSYASTYPRGRDLFIEEQWEMGIDGRFKRPVANSLGVWLAVPDGAVVEWLASDPTEVTEG
jgi:hypothetical protein